MADLFRPLDYLALPLSHVYAFADAGAGQRGDALMLAFYCAQVLNHGVIAGARGWSEWQWVTRVRIKQAPGADAPGLWSWQGEDLHVLCYDVEYEAKCLTSRRRGRDAVNARWGNTDVDTDVHTDVIQVKESKGKERKEDGKGELGNAMVVGRAHAAPAPAPDGEEAMAFRAWLAALCQAHPSARKSHVLGKDVQAAALEAFARCPQAVEAAPLLAAYLADKMPEDRCHEKFWRPTGQRRFFEDLEDVLAHAERWARETGWGKAKHRVQKAPAGGRCLQDATPEEVQAEFARMRAKLMTNDK